jgi:hypothetical protein
MPGLADMHMHLRYDWLSDAWPVSPLNLYLANGVTTIRAIGSEIFMENTLDWAKPDGCLFSNHG